MYHQQSQADGAGIGDPGGSPSFTKARARPGQRATIGSVNLERSSASGEGPKACPSCGARFPADALFCALDGSPLTASPVVIAAAATIDPYLGREILGHIEIRQLVGIGSMGRVYRAFQRGIDRDVAVKILHRELSSNAALVARFDREAKVASRLAHPNVVHVLLVGQLPDGAMYIVMEYLDGMSLQSALAASDGALPLPRALHIALQLSDAVGEGHAQGIVHRDLKPENVMLVRRADDPDFVKVLDFGVARMHWGEPSMATAAGLIFGTARYISPEGAQGETVGPQGDVYSIATMVYQMLSDQAVALLVQQIHDPPPPIDRIPRASYVPEPIAAVIMRNLSKRPGDRAEDGRAFARTLLEAAVSSGLSAQDVLTRPAMRSGARGSHTSAVQMPSMQRTRQLQLEPETAARIGAVTAYETPAPSVAGPDRAPSRTEIRDPYTLPPGAATTRWSSPPRLETKILTPIPSGVDMTMDDQPASQPRLAAFSTPSPLPAVTRSAEFEAGLAGSRASQPPSASKPPSSVGSTLAGDAASRTRRGSASLLRGAVFAVLCLAVGALGMTGVAWKAGLVGNVSVRAPVLGPAMHDPEPIAADHVYSPPEVTATEASRPLPSLDPPVPPLADVARQALSPSARLPSSGGTAAPARAVVVEASAARPGVGQPVDFSAKVPGPSAARAAKVDGACFLIAGPGIAPGTELPASDDGDGVFRSTFTFLQGGRFDVVFSARADGSPVRGARAIVVGQTVTASPASRGSETPPLPADVSGGANAKWL
jgi:serine/threonine protein kinase